jgi:hypothetical protein
MVEAYWFLAAFPFQILTMSILMPAWFIGYVRTQANRIPAERLRQLYPDIDHRQTLGRYLSRYRIVNIVIALLGVPLLTWFYIYMQRADWTDGPVEGLIAAYFMVQSLPFGYVIAIAAKHHEVLNHLSQSKRTAALERRGLFEFVSPSVVALAVGVYFLFIAYVFYIAQDPFPSFALYRTIGAVTLVYVINSIAVYWTLYGPMPNPYEPRSSRAHDRPGRESLRVLLHRHRVLRGTQLNARATSSREMGAFCVERPVRDLCVAVRVRFRTPATT